MAALRCVDGLRIQSNHCCFIPRWVLEEGQEGIQVWRHIQERSIVLESGGALLSLEGFEPEGPLQKRLPRVHGRPLHRVHDHDGSKQQLRSKLHCRSRWPRTLKGAASSYWSLEILNKETNLFILMANWANYGIRIALWLWVRQG